MHTQHKVVKVSGFTIVELLIAIVVIVVLAAISVVAYNGIQERARYSVMRQDLKSLSAAVNMYYAENGKYPTYSGGSTGCNTASSVQVLAIDDLVPDFTSKIPVIPNDGAGGYYAYCVPAARGDYKLLRLTGNGKPLSSVELSDPGIDHRTNADGSKRAWGIWSLGGVSL